MKQEMFPIVDELGKVIGKECRSVCHNGSKILHPVVHLHVLNSNNELYLQKRSLRKDIQPGKWDTAVGGHVDYGEDIETALRREASEELGIKAFDFTRILTYVFESDIEKELVHTHITTYDGLITPCTDETDGGQFWKMDDIKSQLGKSVFTPNFEQEFVRLLSAGLFTEVSQEQDETS